MPNDKGAWMLGRAGWCNGRDVKPWVRRRAYPSCSQDCLSSPFVSQSYALVHHCTQTECFQPCPKLHPQVIDITNQLAPAGQTNKLRYAALFNGTQPLPEQKTGSIMLSANLVLWEAQS